MDKTVADLHQEVDPIHAGAKVMIGGSGGAVDDEVGVLAPPPL